MVVGVLIYSFAFEGALPTITIGLATSVIGAVAVHKFQGQTGLFTLFKGFAFAAAVASVPVALFHQEANLASYLASAIFMVIMFYAFVIFIDVEMESSKDSGSLSGACLLLSSLGIMTSSLLMPLIGARDISGTALFLVALAGVCFMLLMFMPSRDFQTSSWGFSNHLPVESSEARRMRRCGELAEHYGLTARELEVLQILSDNGGKTEIATMLGISPHTAKTHIHNVYAKLGISGMRELSILLQ